MSEGNVLLSGLLVGPHVDIPRLSLIGSVLFTQGLQVALTGSGVWGVHVPSPAGCVFSCLMGPSGNMILWGSSALACDLILY